MRQRIRGSCSRFAVIVVLAALPATFAATATAQQFQVVGTCADGQCGLNIRNFPCWSHCTRIGGLYDGNVVDVICQTKGELVTPGLTAATRVWDEIAPAGSYVTDAYINTPGRGSGTFSLPRCAPSAAIGSPGSGGVYNQGQQVGTSFSCSETPDEGDGIASCTDSHGGSSPGGSLDTSTPGGHTYTITATSTDGATGAASISYTVRGTPTAIIEEPAAGGHYLEGAAVPTRFSCSDGFAGPGIQACVDSGGVSTGAGTIDTSAPGAHSYVVTAKSSDGLTGSAEIAYTVGAAKVTCAGNSGKARLSPGVTAAGAVQVLKVTGSLTGCTGGPFTAAKYTATLKTSGPVDCQKLHAAGVAASGAVVAKWVPKTKGAESNGDLSMILVESSSSPVGGSLDSGQFAGTDIAGSVAETLAKATACGVETAGKPAKPLKSATFTGSKVSLY